jgi:hypothetical protein
MTTAVGIIGALLILVGFLANLFGHMSRTSTVYQVVNVLGASILVWFGVATGAFIFVGLEVVWALAAIYGIFGRLGRSPTADDGRD